MLCDILFTDHPLLKWNINHKVKLERKKCCISNHDSTAVALTCFVWKIPEGEHLSSEFELADSQVGFLRVCFLAFL